MGNRLTVEPIMIPQAHPTYNADNEAQFRRSIEQAFAKLSAQARSGDPPTISSVVVTLHPDGSIVATVTGNSVTQSFRALIQSTLPADVTLRAASATNGSTATLTSSSLGGTVGYVSVFPYGAQNGVGEEGDRFDAQFSTDVSAAIPQGTVAVSGNGSVSFTVDLPPTAGSYFYLGQTSGYASDAATVGGGTLVALGGNHTDTRTAITTLSFGQTEYVAIVPFTGAGGTGTQLQAIHIQGAYVSYSGSKTANYSRVSLRRTHSLNPIGEPNFTASDYSPSNPALVGDAVAPQSLALGFRAILPVGVTMVSAAFDATWNAAGTAIQDANCFALNNGTVLNSGSFTYSIGAQTVTVSLTGTVGSSDAISCVVNCFGPNSGAATASADQIFFGDVRFTYTMPDPLKTV